MRMAANLDEIIATADEVYREPANHKIAEAFNRGQIKIRVGTNAYEADVLTAIKPDTREIFYDIVNIKATKIEASGGTHVESEDSRSRLPETSNQSITQSTVESKENNAAVQKNVRYQLAEQDELAKLRTEQQQLTKQRSALKEERSAWLNSAEVQRIEAKKKALGVFSAEGKAYRDSAEYQDYLAKRKEYNSRLAALEERDSALTEQMKAANERLQQRKDAQAKDAQRAYDAKAKEYGGNAEYRRVLAKEQFGVTEEFRRAGYILPDGQMLDFAQNDRSRDTDHREILEVFGPAEVKNGTEALNEFLLDGNVRVMAEAPGVDISADTAPRRSSWNRSGKWPSSWAASAGSSRWTSPQQTAGLPPARNTAGVWMRTRWCGRSGSITRPESWRRKAVLQSSVSSWRSRPAGRQRRTTSGRRAGILRTRRRHWTP